MTRSSSWGLDTDRELDWRQFAVCGPDNADWFFVTSVGGHLSRDNEAALRLCARCPVTSECLTDARKIRVDLTRIAGGEVIQDRERKPRADVTVPTSGHTARHDRRWHS
jgi:WhiB family redox-sensing transcriptional regulator